MIYNISLYNVASKLKELWIITSSTYIENIKKKKKKKMMMMKSSLIFLEEVLLALVRLVFFLKYLEAQRTPFYFRV